MFGEPAILKGSVVHQRVQPVAHRLEYRVFSLLLDLDRLDEAGKGRRLFSVDRFNLLSFHRRDVADGATSDLAAHARRLVADELAITNIRSVWLLTYPRVLGYVFNPLSVYFCLDGEGNVAALVYEVSNTFGARVSYVSAVRDGRIDGAAKSMLVSPFNRTTGEYRFGFSATEEEMTVGVALHDLGKPVLKTWFRARRHDLGDARILASVLAMPFMTLKVIAAIHYEALKLWLKGLRPPARGQGSGPETGREPERAQARPMALRPASPVNPEN